MDSFLRLVDQQVIAIEVDFTGIFEFLTRFDHNRSRPHITHLEVNRNHRPIGVSGGDFVLAGQKTGRGHQNQNQRQESFRLHVRKVCWIKIQSFKSHVNSWINVTSKKYYFEIGWMIPPNITSGRRIKSFSFGLL